MEAIRLVDTNTSESDRRHFYNPAPSPRASIDNQRDPQLECVISVWDDFKQSSLRDESVAQRLTPGDQGVKTDFY